MKHRQIIVHIHIYLYAIDMCIYTCMHIYTFVYIIKGRIYIIYNMYTLKYITYKTLKYIICI